MSDPVYPHRIVLPGEKWSLWRWLTLRGAGFAASNVLKLAAPRAALVSDKLRKAEEETEIARSRALAVVNAELDKLRADGLWHERSQRAPLLKAMKLLSSGKRPEEADACGPMQQALLQLKTADRCAAELGDELDCAFSADQFQISGAIVEMVADERFCEAIVWQNRRAFHTCVKALLRTTGGKPAKGSTQRQHEEMIASYIQRYSVKNDTIGYFGPVGWARINDSRTGVSAKALPDFVSARNVYCEVWAMQAVADTINRFPGIRESLAPRIYSFLRVENDGLYIPSKGKVPLPEDQIAILKACNGRDSADTVATKILRCKFADVHSAADVFDFLELMESSGIIGWKLDVAVQLHPELSLREQLLRIKDQGVRSTALALLEELESCCDTVRASAGCAEKLDRALAAMEETFTRLTGGNATRAPGQTYAARTLVFEDCRRGFDLEFGREVVSALASPLSLLLTSARWFSYEAAAQFRKAFDGVYDDLAGRTSKSGVDFASFIGAANPMLFDEQSSLVGAVTALFQKKWKSVLLPYHVNQAMQYASRELHGRVEEAFNAPHAGWKAARYHSPDVMIAADNIEAIRRGDYLFTMGELHIGMNTIGQNLFVAQHPAPDELQEAARIDLADPVFAMVASKASRYISGARLMPALLSEKDYRIHAEPDCCDDRAGKILCAGELDVVREDGTLFVTNQQGTWRYDLLDVLGESLSVAVSDGFNMIAPQAFTPRVSIDRLVVSRACWRFSLGEAEFIHLKTSLERFHALRRWAAVRNIPRFVFVKVPGEQKPFYLDHDSPIYVDILCRLLRRAHSISTDTTITYTEMLPGHGQLWLFDSADTKYTSELRMVAVDLSR